MKRPRFSLAALMVVVAVIGAEVALLRNVVDGRSGLLPLALAVVSPMLMALGYGLHALLRRRARAPYFWGGFTAVGGVATVLMFMDVFSLDGLLTKAYDRLVVGPLVSSALSTIDGGVSHREAADHDMLFWGVAIPLELTLYNLPSAVSAIVAGWLWTRYHTAVVSTPRHHGAPVPSDEASIPLPETAPDLPAPGAVPH